MAYFGVDLLKLQDLKSSRDYRLVRKALVRKHVGRRPNVRETRALDVAALLALRAQIASTEEGVSADAMVKVLSAARRAEAALAAVAGERKRPVAADPANMRMLAAGEVAHG
jgi:hypothetical protein